ncbi:hypothetical protein DFJ63DRAFT_68464 [Scheffersomyces coipomensis]|uniref:uncharacterized protein n=1 Tax=Scheffersomyces coipomensis TaxID=1788519 RepID=UPI00315DE0AD
MIQITEKELLEYHANIFNPSIPISEITDYITNNKNILRNPNNSEPQFKPNLSNLTVDPETLDEYFNSNRNEILKNEEVQSFIESQRIHKADFLAEIKHKGLSLKHNPPQQGQKSESTRKVLNY